MPFSPPTRPSTSPPWASLADGRVNLCGNNSRLNQTNTDDGTEIRKKQYSLQAKRQSRADIEALREFCEREGEAVEYRKSDQLEREGAPARWFGFVTEGCFKYVNHSSDDREHITWFSCRHCRAHSLPVPFALSRPPLRHSPRTL